jgi:hypothetical protein
MPLSKEKMKLYMRRYRYRWFQEGLNNEGQPMVMLSRSHGRKLPRLYEQTNYSESYLQQKKELGL